MQFILKALKCETLVGVKIDKTIIRVSQWIIAATHGSVYERVELNDDQALMMQNKTFFGGLEIEEKWYKFLEGWGRHEGGLWEF